MAFGSGSSAGFHLRRRVADPLSTVSQTPGSAPAHHAGTGVTPCFLYAYRVLLPRLSNHERAPNGCWMGTGCASSPDVRDDVWSSQEGSRRKEETVNPCSTFVRGRNFKITCAISAAVRKERGEILL